MNKSKNIKVKFVESFLKLLKDSPVDKITVKDIVSNSDFSRQTFYRYFSDIDDLIYYIHISNVSIGHEYMKKFGFSLNALKMYLDLMLLNESFYRQIITLDQSNSFTRWYIKKTKENIVKYFFNYNYETIINNKELLFSLNFFTYGFAYTILEWIKNDSTIPTKYLAKALVNNMPQNLKELMDMK
ncbi:TetR/AcrR family transcriptional regulator [Miniphocaeibacter massiliensis]|uniref:TetR/AcrR family transcriptional regulator n=1 Tax=Miniphocaeibacter massiliensis TaxID=2041841 RepID=UPI000C1C6C98|nr:TetR/AcrR family transcriptional regulator [Miniphocaeibacter massiliensis]